MIPTPSRLAAFTRALSLGVAGLLAITAVHAQAPASTDPKTTAMTSATPALQAKGTFEVRMAPQALANAAADKSFGRMTIDKTFSGDLQGTGSGEMLMAGTAVKGSAAYVAIERVDGTIGDRSGSFALQHTGTMDRGAPSLRIGIVPDSGTGDFAGIAGTLAIDITGGKHFYTLDYTLPGTAPAAK